jgi:RNA polymerase sigma factor (sigma-70 family)
VTTISALPLAPVRRLSPDDFWPRWLAERGYFRLMCVRWLRGNRQEAEDVLSRGALRALTHLRKHPDRVEKFRPWALRLLHNLCLDTLEAAGRCTHDLDAARDDDDDPAALECPVALPDRVVYGHELRLALSDALADLPPRLAAAFRLRCVDGLAYDEICRQLTISPENARKRVQQARAYLCGRLAHVA